ncbi:unnamed protein product, partial [Mesorhabditis spiculigera]
MADDPNATQIFIAEERKLFERMFPTPRVQNRHNISSSSILSTPQARFNTSQGQIVDAASTHAKLFEATEENKWLRKQLKQEKENVASIENELKASPYFMGNMADTGAQLLAVTAAANKLYNYHIRQRAELEVMQKILARHRLWTPMLRSEIRASYNGMKITELTDEMMATHAQGSSLDYQGIDEVEFVEAPEESPASPEVDEDTADLTTGSRFRQKVVNDTMQLARKRSGSGPHRMLSPILSTGTQMTSVTEEEPAEEAPSICDQTMNSVDYENYEKIQKLEAENSQMRQQLFIAKSHAKNALLYREQKMDIESKYNFVNKKLEETMRDLTALRNATARNMFGSEDGVKHVDRMTSMQQQIDDLLETTKKLKAQLEESENSAEEAHGLLEDQRMTCDSLNAQIEELEDQKRTLEEHVAELQLRYRQSSKEVDVLKSDVYQKSRQIEELEKAARSNQADPTDAGDTTQIFHVRANPLEMAREELRQKDDEEERERKRKLSETSSSGDVEFGSKRAKTEIAALEEQLRKAEQSKNKAVDIQMSMARRYREVSTALTGYQIKMRDDACHVVSCLGQEPEDAFTFKFEDGQLMLLSREDGSSEISSQKWRDEMDRYIGELHSVPAFLSRVTITLAENNPDDQTLSQPSFSIIRD